MQLGRPAFPGNREASPIRSMLHPYAANPPDSGKRFSVHRPLLHQQLSLKQKTIFCSSRL